MNISEITSIEDVKTYLGELVMPDGTDARCECPENCEARLKVLEANEPKALTKAEMNKVVRAEVQKFLKNLVGD